MSRPSRKRFKKTHGPDFVENFDSAIFEEIPELGATCDYCLSVTCNRNGENEELLVCKDCKAKAHPSCMDYSVDLARRSRMSPWQCVACKTCRICEDAEDADSMLFCDSCDKGYHVYCHQPKIIGKPQGKWVCQQCRTESDLSSADAEGICKINISNVISMQKNAGGPSETMMDTDEVGSSKCTVDGATGLPTPCDSPVPEVQRENNTSRLYNSNSGFCEKKENPSMVNIPDATEWSIEDVEKYFCSVGFSDQAKAFGEQEIDGKSLLLMKRSDVLTGLALKLGPALKIYNYIRRLQLKHADDEVEDF